MNRDEKNLQTRQKIMNSALKEFGEKSYGEASLNTICQEGNISKGIIYHYFKDKDELYKSCVKECFDALIEFLKNSLPKGGDNIQQSMADYFGARAEFFDTHPEYLKIFCSAVMRPPKHLQDDITLIKAEFDLLNISALTDVLKSVKLRDDISVPQVVDIFFDYQDLINTRFQLESFGKSTLKDHEERCLRSLQILLYGVIERKA